MRRLLTAILLLLPSMAVAQGSFAVPTYTAGSLGSSATVATPSFSPGGGTYSSTQTVTISSATGGAVIWYNNTGTFTGCTYLTCSGATLYTTSVTVSTTQTLYAIGTLATYTNSAVGSAAYTISTPTPTFSQYQNAVPNSYPAVTGSFSISSGDLLFAYCVSINSRTDMSMASTFSLGSWSSGTIETEGTYPMGAFTAIASAGGTGTVTCNSSGNIRLKVMVFHTPNGNTINSTAGYSMAGISGSGTGTVTFSASQRTLNIMCGWTNDSYYSSWTAGTINSLTAVLDAPGGSGNSDLACEDVLTTGSVSSVTGTINITANGSGGGGIMTTINY